MELRGQNQMNEELYNNILDLAEDQALLASCIRRRFGAIVMNKEQEVVSSGSNASPDGTKSCVDLGYCIRNKLNIPRGTRYELCRSVHAEANAIIKASREDLIGTTLFLVGLEPDGSYVVNTEPCAMCKKLIVNSGIASVVTRISKTDYKEILVHDWVDNDTTTEGKDSYSQDK